MSVFRSLLPCGNIYTAHADDTQLVLVTYVGSLFPDSYWKQGGETTAVWGEKTAPDGAVC